MPYGTNIASLVPKITVSSNATIFPKEGEARDFSQQEVKYTVTAQNGARQDYFVNVTLGP